MKQDTIKFELLLTIQVSILFEKLEILA